MVKIMEVKVPPIYSGAVAFPRRSNLEFLYIKQILAAAAVCCCCALVSGQMWNHIRRPPLAQKSNNGPVYISGGARFQFRAESYIVAVMNGVIALGMILIIEAEGGVKNTGIIPTQIRYKRRWFLSVVGLVLFFAFFSLLASVFGSKWHGYPFCFSLIFK